MLDIDQLQGVTAYTPTTVKPHCTQACTGSRSIVCVGAKPQVHIARQDGIWYPVILIGNQDLVNRLFQRNIMIINSIRHYIQY